MSVAGSDLHAGVKGAPILVGANGMMIDWRRRCAVCSWYGQQFSQKFHGKTWHYAMFWVQERVDSGEIRMENRNGEHNTADIGTKAVSAAGLMKHFKTLKIESRDGQHLSALDAAI